MDKKIRLYAALALASLGSDAAAAVKSLEKALSDEEWFVRMFSELDAELSILINEGSLGGLPITAQVVQRLNAIEQDLNSLKNAFQNWVVSP